MNPSLSDIIRELSAEDIKRLLAKVPDWAGVEGLRIPSRLNVEQCSSQATAQYKAALASSICPSGRVADLTGGLGVDCFYFARLCAQALFNDHNPALRDSVEHNMRLLGADNIVYRSATVEPSCVNNILGDFRPDIIYLDPARRAESGKKVFLLEDCSPDIINLKEELLEICPELLVKVSPMADIPMLLKRLGNNLCEIHILGVAGECKELLLRISRKVSDDCRIIVAENGASFSFCLSQEKDAKASVLNSINGLQPGSLLYIPNSSLMKSAAFSLISEGFGLTKLGHFSHLYVGESKDETLAKLGKYHLIAEIHPMGNKACRELGRKYPRCEVSARNMPLSSDALRKKLGVASGDNAHIFGTTIDTLSEGSGRYLIVTDI